MANRSYNDRTPDGTSDPLKGEDLIGVSNEDGGGGYDLSKKILVSEFSTYIKANLDPVLTGVTTLVVATGTSGTGVKGEWNSPYPTVLLAKADAVSGDTIVVFGDVVDETEVLKNGVDIVINGNVTHSGSGYVFSDAGSTVNCNVTIHGDIILTGSGGALFSSDASSIINLKCFSIKQANLSSFSAIDIASGGSIEFNGNIDVNADEGLSVVQVSGGSANFKMRGNITDIGGGACLSVVNGSVDFKGNISADTPDWGVSVGVGATFKFNGDITNVGTGMCIESTGGTFSYKGDVHSEGGKCILLNGNITGKFEGGFSSNSQVAGDSCFIIDNNSTGKVTIKGNIDLTNANSTAGSLLIRDSVAEIHIHANVSSTNQKVIISTQTSTGLFIYGRVVALGTSANAHPITLENSGNNECVLGSGCILVTESATAYGVSNDSNGSAQNFTNYGAVSNRPLDAALSAAKVTTVLIDSNVK